jgi:hypothetical protein
VGLFLLLSLAVDRSAKPLSSVSPMRPRPIPTQAPASISHAALTLALPTSAAHLATRLLWRRQARQPRSTLDLAWLPQPRAPLIGHCWIRLADKRVNVLNAPPLPSPSLGFPAHFRGSGGCTFIFHFMNGSHFCGSDAAVLFLFS